MHKFKKSFASLLCLTMFLFQAFGLSGIQSNIAKAEPTGVNTALMTQYGLNSNSYFWKKAIWNKTTSSFARDVVSRPYPRLVGNQWNVTPEGNEDQGDTNRYQEYAAKYLDFMFLNRVRGGYSDKFVDVYDSVKNPNMGLLKYRNNIYAKAAKYNRRCYVLAYHAAEGIENYSPPTSGYNYWFSNHADNPWRTSSNQGTWNLVTSKGLWYRNNDGSYVQYGSYSTSVRRVFDQRNAQMQQYWANHAYNASIGDGTTQLDGIFADNWLRSAGPDSTNWRAGVNKAGGLLKSRWNGDKILIGNGYYSSDYNTRDFGMIEDFSKNWTWDYSQSDAFANNGRLALDTTGVPSYGDMWTRLARNLMTDDLYALHDDENGNFVTFVDNYLSKLGKIGYPIEDRVNNNGVYSRRFTHGIAYWNNSGTTRTVTVPSGLYRDINGNNVEGNISLANRKGLIFKTRSGAVPVVTAPSAPTNLALTSMTMGADTGNVFANVSWTDNANNESGFEIYRALNSTTNYTKIQDSTANATNASINLGQNPSSGVYYFKIRAVNSAGASSFSNEIQKEIISKPAAPTNCVVNSVSRNSAGQVIVALSWSDNSTNETSFEVLHSTDNTTFDTVATPTANLASSTINLGTNPTVGTHYFKIDAINAGGKSDPSNVAQAKVEAGQVLAPTGLAITSTTKGATTGNYYVNLKWADNAGDETGYEILHATSNGTYEVIKSTSANVTTYGVNVGNAPATGLHYFKIVAVRNADKSADSNIVNVELIKTVPTPTIVKAPTGLAITGVTKGSSSGSYYINLKWADNASDETGYEILRSLNNTSSFTVVKTTTANATTYGVNIGSTNVAGTNYFKVRAIKDTAKSADSNVVNTKI